MAVMEGKDNNLFVDCHCGCGEGLRIRVDKDDTDFYVMMSYVTNSGVKCNTLWSTFCSKLRKIWYIVRGKDYYYSDIYMNKDEFTQYQKYIAGI